LLFFASSLEQDLLLLTTHYIEKDEAQRSLRAAAKRPATGRRTLAKPQEVCLVQFAF